LKYFRYHKNNHLSPENKSGLFRHMLLTFFYGYFLAVVHKKSTGVI